MYYKSLLACISLTASLSVQAAGDTEWRSHCKELSNEAESLFIVRLAGASLSQVMDSLLTRESPLPLKDREKLAVQVYTMSYDSSDLEQTAKDLKNKVYLSCAQKFVQE